ncbi:MAG TPA: phosphorylase [Terriglobales bacterium]
MPRIAIVAAMEREVAPLVRKWKVREVEHSGRRYKLFESGETSLICAGVGPEAARRATEAIIQEVRASHILSVGFVGALDPALRVGEVIEPRTVINAADGVRTDTGSGRGTLVSFSTIAGREQKEKLREAYSAAAVDMEAAAVAQGAELRSVRFGALKVVSDEAGFVMLPVENFVEADGSFRAARFTLHVAVRPWLWGATIVLARNSARASNALCAALEQYLSRRATEEIAEHR